MKVVRKPGPVTSSIRGQYERHGADGYYRKQGSHYRNPHEPSVRRLIVAASERWSLDLSHVLDLAAGSGEATLALREIGASSIDAVDPFTFEAYQRRTGGDCERHTFAEVAAGALADRHYSLVVCSFALHLCAPSRLPGVAQQLGQCAAALLIITPHKRPIIESSWGWSLEGEQVIERVRSRCYRAVKRVVAADA